ncbi:MAG TPA: hypothetical protein VGH33_11840 [Isosphaeraceae bacterium]
MSGPDEGGGFLAALSRMDDPTVGLLDAYFHARDAAWRKLYCLGSLAEADEGEPPPEWSLWHRDVPRLEQVELVETLAAVIRAELTKRQEAAIAADRARRATITPGDAEALSDAELAAMRLVLNSPGDDSRSRWRLLAGLGALWARGWRPAGWPKWGRIAEGSEEARVAASAALEAEAMRRELLKGRSAGPTGSG